MNTIEEFIIAIKQETLKLRFHLDGKEPVLAEALIERLLNERSRSATPLNAYSNYPLDELKDILYNKGLDNLVILPSTSGCVAMEEGRMPFDEFVRVLRKQAFE